MSSLKQATATLDRTHTLPSQKHVKTASQDKPLMAQARSAYNRQQQGRTNRPATSTSSTTRVERVLKDIQSIEMVFQNYELGARKTTRWQRLPDDAEEFLKRHEAARKDALHDALSGGPLLKPPVAKRKRASDESTDHRPAKKQAGASSSSTSGASTSGSKTSNGANADTKPDSIKLGIYTEPCVGKHIVETVHCNGKPASNCELGVTLVTSGGLQAALDLLRQHSNYQTLDQAMDKRNRDKSRLKTQYGVFQMVSDYHSPFLAIVHEDYGWPVSIRTRKTPLTEQQKKAFREELDKIHDCFLFVNKLNQNNLFTHPDGGVSICKLEDLTPMDIPSYNGDADALDADIMDEAEMLNQLLDIT